MLILCVNRWKITFIAVSKDVTRLGTLEIIMMTSKNNVPSVYVKIILSHHEHTQRKKKEKEEDLCELIKLYIRKGFSSKVPPLF